jgi:hypothetical protein
MSNEAWLYVTKCAVALLTICAFLAGLIIGHLAAHRRD